MKRFILLFVGAFVIIGVQFFVNCSNPLENLDDGDFDPTGPIIDTLFNEDTIVVLDTLTYLDTIYIEDTLILVDTITVIDTVVIVNPDSSGSLTVCSRIASNQQEIIWMFRNTAGTYLLEFTAAPESDHPTQTVSVYIEGEEFLWKPTENHEFITEMNLGDNTSIVIIPKKPPSFGHAIYICLTLSRL